jgi:zinc/manganese transport system ATP-binding protein
VSVRLGGRQMLTTSPSRVAPGEFTGLIGPNGAGKTTLLRVILGLRAADGGGLVDGGRGARASAGHPPDRLRAAEDPSSRTRRCVRATWSRSGSTAEGSGRGCPSRGRRERWRRMLADVGATAFADERVGTLSGGEQQRVLIAHALISRPRCC